MENVHSFHFSSCDGQSRCYAQEWMPPDRPRAVLQIVHGMTEHIGRYDQAAQFFCRHGILVCGEDHLGHGKSAVPGRHGHFADRDGWDIVTRDILKLREIQGKKYPDVPYILLGHSMGSFLVRTLLCRYPGQVDAAILSGTAHKPLPLLEVTKWISSLLCALRGKRHVSPLIRKLTMAVFNAPFQPIRTTADWISRDTQEVDRYQADPYTDFFPSLAMIRDMIGGLQYIASPQALRGMDPDTPVYFLSGGDDPVGGQGKDLKKLYALFCSNGVRDATLKLYPGGRHEMFHECNRQEVFQDTLNWIEAHI